jgi:hypothetical protein
MTKQEPRKEMNPWVQMLTAVLIVTVLVVVAFELWYSEPQPAITATTAAMLAEHQQLEVQLAELNQISERMIRSELLTREWGVDTVMEWVPTDNMASYGELDTIKLETRWYISQFGTENTQATFREYVAVARTIERWQPIPIPPEMLRRVLAEYKREVMARMRDLEQGRY